MEMRWGGAVIESQNTYALYHANNRVYLESGELGLGGAITEFQSTCTPHHVDNN